MSNYRRHSTSSWSAWVFANTWNLNRARNVVLEFNSLLFVCASVCLLTTFTLVGLLVVVFFSDWDTSFNVECVGGSVSSLIVFICTSGLITTIYCFNGVKFIRNFSVMSWSISVRTGIKFTCLSCTKITARQVTITVSFLLANGLNNLNYFLITTTLSWSLFNLFFNLLFFPILSLWCGGSTSV